MSDSGIKTTPRNWVGMALMALVSGCSDSTDIQIDPTGYDGITETAVPLLSNPCVIDTAGTKMTMSVQAGETLYVTLRTADGKVVAGGSTSSGGECAVPPTYKLFINEDSGHAGTEKVFLDYVNGTFALGATVANVVTPGITVALGAGSTLTVRGSAGVDKVYLGSSYTTSGQTTTLAHSWLNVNGDTSPDVRFDGITDVKVSTGPGADIITADGGNGMTGVTPLDATITFSAFGGADNDTLTGGKGASSLDGGDGDDLFLQSATTFGADVITGGKGTDTVDYSTRTASVKVTVCTTCVMSDPCMCIATESTCEMTAGTTKTSCLGTATSQHTTCIGNATSAHTTCTGSASSTHASCVQTASDNEQTCEAACTVGDQTCIDACTAQQTTDVGNCDSAQTQAVAACDATQTSSNATCDMTQTSSNATCNGTYTSSVSSCQQTQTSCQATCSQVPCSACVQDDGDVAHSEGDTVNDDVEVVLGSKADDTINASHAVCSNGAATPVVKCTLKGNDGNDTIIGSAFADAIDGGKGDDYIQPGLGDDTIVGGDGNDTVSYSERSNAVKVSLTAANLWGGGPQNGEVGEADSIAADVENLTGGAGADFLRGSAGNNIIHGGAGNDVIEGLGGNDALYGEAGADTLFGGAGNDLLVGGAGADIFYGGDGDDLLDTTDSPATADTIFCDGQNDQANTVAASAPGTTDTLVKDSSDMTTGTSACEIIQ